MVDILADNNIPKDAVKRQQSKEVDAPAVSTVATTMAEDVMTPPTSPRPITRCTSHQHPSTINDGATSVATALDSYDGGDRPRIKPCSLNPSTWSKRRIRIALCGCLSSAMVCTIRLLLDPGPSAYIIHSIVILFDMILIHIFTYTPWLSIAGEITAIVFATCFHLTNLTIFELVETTLIAVYVSFHMIKSRNEHWDREEGLERDVIGLQFYIEHHNHTTHDKNDENPEATMKAGNIATRQSSSISKVTTPADIRRRSSGNQHTDQDDLQTDIEAGKVRAGTTGTVLVPESDMTNMSSFTTTLRQDSRPNNNSNNINENETKKSWWNHFFDHFLDGSAGVLYTSFVGLIIDEIVNLGPLSKAKSY